MGIRFTGFSTPIGGLEWEYTNKNVPVARPLVQPGQKLKVFVSSICGKSRYDKVRSELSNLLKKLGSQQFIFLKKKALRPYPPDRITYMLSKIAMSAYS